MAEIKDSQLPAAQALANNDILAISQDVGGVLTSTKVTLGEVKTFSQSGDTPAVVTDLSISAGVLEIDLSLGRDFIVTLSENVTSITFLNMAGSGFVSEFDLEVRQDATGGRTFALPAGFHALGGSDTTIATAANSVTVLSAKTFDNGLAWRYAMQESA